MPDSDVSRLIDKLESIRDGVIRNDTVLEGLQRDLLQADQDRRELEKRVGALNDWRNVNDGVITETRARLVSAENRLGSLESDRSRVRGALALLAFAVTGFGSYIVWLIERRP